MTIVAEETPLAPLARAATARGGEDGAAGDDAVAAAVARISDVFISTRSPVKAPLLSDAASVSSEAGGEGGAGEWTWQIDRNETFGASAGEFLVCHHTPTYQCSLT